MSLASLNAQMTKLDASFDVPDTMLSSVFSGFLCSEPFPIILNYSYSLKIVALFFSHPAALKFLVSWPLDIIVWMLLIRRLITVFWCSDFNRLSIIQSFTSTHVSLYLVSGCQAGMAPKKISLLKTAFVLLHATRNYFIVSGVIGNMSGICWTHDINPFSHTGIYHTSCINSTRFKCIAKCI